MTVEERLEQLEHQQAIQTEAIKAFAEGNMDGPGSVKAFLLALNPNLQVTPAPFVFDA